VIELKLERDNILFSPDSFKVEIVKDSNEQNCSLAIFEDPMAKERTFMRMSNLDVAKKCWGWSINGTI